MTGWHYSILAIESHNGAMTGWRYSREMAGLGNEPINVHLTTGQVLFKVQKKVLAVNVATTENRNHECKKFIRLDMPPTEAILAPLEAELKLARQEIAKLQDDNKALDKLTKSKEATLLEAERTVQVALAKASMVDNLQNNNQELIKQIEICQEEPKTLDWELARAKITANRVATVVANEWKYANDKVMPVNQWLEERTFLQGEMQQMRDKLAITERAARSEAQLKVNFC